MSHANKLTLDRQVYDALQERNGLGRSKHQDKALGLTDQYIYSRSTMKTYLRHCDYFVDWCRQNPQIRNDLGHKPRTLAECKPYVEQWIRIREAEGKSAYTVKLEKSALEKLYGERFEFATRGISRTDIRRSRGEAVRDAHFSEERNAELVNCCRHVGFRRAELEKARPQDLIRRDGQYYVRITGKGGRFREAPVLDNDPRTVAYLQTLTGRNHVHSGADIHSYRADYATAVYTSYARPVEALRGRKIDFTAITGKYAGDGSRIVKSALYHCRGDQRGRVLDREAMIRASQALGHNRESVVAEHYIKD